MGFYLKAVFPSRNYVLRSFVNFWVICGDIWEAGLVKFRGIRNGEDLM